MADRIEKLVTGFESPTPRTDIRLRKGEFVIAPRTLGGPRASPELRDIARTAEESEDIAAREEMSKANAKMRNRRRVAKQRAERAAERDKKLAELTPPDKHCLLCKRHKPHVRQWVVCEVNGIEVAMCVGCARVLRNAGAMKKRRR